MFFFSFIDFILEPGSHSSLLQTDNESQRPKPTPRLKKSSTNDTNNTSTSSQNDDSSLTSSLTITNQNSEQILSDDLSSSTDSFKQRKQFWETLETKKSEEQQQFPPVPKPRNFVKDSFDTDTSSLRSLQNSKQVSKEDDSIVVEDRLEDESFPISDRYDSETSESKKDDKIKLDIETEKIVESNLLHDEGNVDDGDSEEKRTSFYVGDSSHNVITRTVTEKRTEFAFDNPGYQYSVDDDKNEEKTADYVHSLQNVEIYDEKMIDTHEKREIEEHLMLKSTGEEKSEFEVSEKVKISAEHSPEAPKRTPPVLHSPIKSSYEVEKPIEMVEEIFTIAKANAIEVVKDTESEAKKPSSFTEIPSKDSFKFDSVSKRTMEELAVEQTLEEVEDSLHAVQEELIEVVKDGKLIKQSPSEFEIKLLPDLKYPTDPIPENEELRAIEMREREKKQEKPVIEIKGPSVEERQKMSEAEDSSVSNEESYDKLDIVRRKPAHPTPKVGTNRWSITDVESSSGESHYQSFERTDSRPLSSDVENLVPSSEYDTAQDISSVPGSTEYHTAASTLTSHSISSRDSMRSFDSESSGGNMASVEASEASETLVPSTMDECEDGLQSDLLQDIESDDNEKYASLGDQSNKEEDLIGQVPSAMKRSHEMTFVPEYKSLVDTADLLDDSKLQFEEKLAKSVEDLKYGSFEEVKFGSSLEEGSMLSVSISSASNLETMVELHPDQADQLMGSLVGSYDSAKIFTSFTDDTVTSSPPDNEPFSKIDSALTSSFSQEQEKFDDLSRSPQTSEFTEGSEPLKKRGHKRTDSTSVFAGGFIKAGSKDSSDSFEEEPVLNEESSEAISSERDETHGESSDSDYDRYESEYARSFRSPITPSSKSKSKTKADILERDTDEKKLYSPGHSIRTETIVEDVHEETEEDMLIKKDKISPSKQDYHIPDIQVTDDIFQEEIKTATTTQETVSQHIQYAKQVEYKMTEEEYQEILAKKYKSKESEQYDFEEDQQPSPGSDSFEMLEQPDISDEFVIVEEVAKEAHEFDQEGKSVVIQPMGKYIRKHDEDVEKYVIKSAPASTDAAAYVTGDINFEFEDSPPQDEDQGTQLRGNGYPLEGSKRWVEMNLSDPANLRYPYDGMERGMLEDIKEEDTEFEVGSSRLSSFKESFSSTPDYDLLARKFHSREHDNISMNSLQEFENLEQVISLENRRQAQSSQESLSNGSLPKRQISRGSHGDDISTNSLKEFEGLENACLEAHLIEIKAKEEAALLLSRSDDSNKSGSSDGLKNGSPKVYTSTSKRTIVSSSVVTTSTSSNISKDDIKRARELDMIMEFQKIDARARALLDESTTTSSATGNVMETSTDSLEGTKAYDKSSSQHLSSDSLDNDNNRSTNVDLMTSSVDSIEMSKDGAGKTSDVDSIEPNSPAKKRSDSIDSIDLQYAISHSSRADRDSLDDTINVEISTTSGSSSNKQEIQKQTVTKTSSSTVTGLGGSTVITTTTITSGIFKQEMPSKDISCESLNRTEPLLTSTESLETSSTATNATYQNETDSQMSGSITSCGSNTLIDTLDSTFPDFYSPTSSQIQQQFHTSSSTTTTTVYDYEHDMFDDENFSPITFSVKPRQNIVVDSDSTAGTHISSYHNTGRILEFIK